MQKDHLPTSLHFFQQLRQDPSAVVHGNVPGQALRVFYRGVNCQDSATALCNSKALVLQATVSDTRHGCDAPVTPSFPHSALQQTVLPGACHLWVNNNKKIFKRGQSGLSLTLCLPEASLFALRQLGNFNCLGR